MRVSAERELSRALVTSIREAYEERKAEFDRPEMVRARHVLIRVDQDADEAEEEQARERAQAILERA